MKREEIDSIRRDIATVEYNISNCQREMSRLQKLLTRLPKPEFERQFQRGDRVKNYIREMRDIVYEGNVIETGRQGTSDIAIQNDDGFIWYSASRYLRLITPAEKREIQVGDEVECPQGLITVKKILYTDWSKQHIIKDTNGREWWCYDCTFRSRPVPPKDDWQVGDKAILVEKDPDYSWETWKVFEVKAVDTNRIYYNSKGGYFPKNICRRVINLQLEGDPLGFGSWALVDDKWNGIITTVNSNGDAFVVDRNVTQGVWRKLSELKPARRKPE